MNISNSPTHRCSRCLMPFSAPGLIETDGGICNVCRDYRLPETKGEEALRLELAYAPAQPRQYDCIVPISGGLDSVYVAFYLTRRMGLRCLGVHYDHGLGSESKAKMLSWLEAELGLPIVVHGWPASESRALVRDSLRALLPFGAQAMQAGLCRHCGYGIRAAVYTEMVAHGLHSVWGKHTFDHIPFRYCTQVAVWQTLRGRRLDALRALMRRYRQARALPSPGAVPIKLLFDSMGYPSLPGRYAHLKNLNFYQYIPWNKRNMLSELHEGGVDIEPLSQAHSDCKLASIVDRVLQAAWTVGKKEIYVCNLVRAGQISKEEGLRQIEAIRQTNVDTSYLGEIGLSEAEIEAVFCKSPGDLAG